MDTQQHGTLVGLLHEWIEAHPHPDDPSLVFFGCRDYTPREIYDEVVARTEFGERFGDVLYAASRRCGKPVEALVRQAIEGETHP